MKIAKPLTAALTTAGLLASASAAEARPNVGMAIALAGSACPGVNPYLNDAVPSPTCAVAGPPFTLENRQPGVIATTPAYGYMPPACYFLSHRWDGFNNPSVFQPWGTVQGGFRVVENWDGHCGGPTVNIPVSISIAPQFHNVYGIGGVYPTGCWPSASGTGAVSAMTMASACAGHTYAGSYDDWERGTYTLEVAVTTPYNSWVRSSTHQVY